MSLGSWSWFLCLPEGFITMTPQLFINYKLKSVAHLPWRMLTYKALNTFIDDLFAFVIKMPVMYRIGCLRDGKAQRTQGYSGRGGASSPLRWAISLTQSLPPDVVFFIYLYQRWIYRVDPTRVNEFGMSGEDVSAAASRAQASTAAGALTPAPSTAVSGEDASTVPKATSGACTASQPQEAPPKPAEDKKKD